ncbi:MAG: hypothetical protein CSA75_00595 [Sorangium cellulosum]|nr:MAG: hypothetical protein CSA75_00595 [Sorangium cellulosum]
MSSEQASGLPVDRRTDIWAFGMLAFEAIVGSPAVDGTMPPGQIVLSICRGNLPVPSQLNASIPAGFDEWFARSTMRNPADRFLSIDEQMSVLDDVLCRRFREKDIKTQVIRAQPCRTMTLPPLVKRSLATGSSYVALQASVVGVNPR